MTIVELDAVRAQRAARQRPPAPAETVSPDVPASQADLRLVADEIGEAVRGLRPDIAAVTTTVKADLDKLKRDLTIRFGLMLAVMTAVLLLGMRYLPPVH